jgi:transposase
MTALDASGRVLQHGPVANQGEALRRYFTDGKSSWKKEEEGPVAVAVEACGFWAPFVEQVEPLVERVVLVHPARVKAIASAKLKNDRIDSAILAQLLRANLLPEAWQADRATRDLREVLRLRVALGQQRTRWKNQVHATLHRHGLRAPVTDLFGVAGRAWLATAELRDAASQVRDTCLRMIDRLDPEIHALDQQLRRQAKADPDVCHLMTIPGIGPFSALVLKAEIGDLGRFRNKRSLYNYAGLVPVLRQSGDHRRSGGITHAGSGVLRWVMSEAAQTAVRCSTGARLYFERLCRRKHRHVARTALARKLLGAVYALWKHGECFDEKVFAAM